MRLGLIFAGILVLLWLGAAALMYRDDARDRFDAIRVGTSRYGHNGEHDLRGGLIAISVEALVALALSAPWARPSAGRAWVGWILSGAWTMLSMLLSMHGGGIIAIHFMWMFVLTGWFFALAWGSGRVRS